MHLAFQFIFNNNRFQDPSFWVGGTCKVQVDLGFTKIGKKDEKDRGFRLKKEGQITLPLTQISTCTGAETLEKFICKQR